MKVGGIVYWHNEPSFLGIVLSINDPWIQVSWIDNTIAIAPKWFLRELIQEGS